jgi:hypothetical protein
MIKKHDNDLYVIPYSLTSEGLCIDIKDDIENGKIFRTKIRNQNGQIWDDDDIILIKGQIISQEDIVDVYRNN